MYRRINRYNLGRTYLQVEEYKLPHFEVPEGFDSWTEGKICWGDSVTVRGNVKAYAGYDIHHAHITYKVYGTMNSQELLTGMGTVESDAYGNFELKTMLYDLNGGRSAWCKVKVTATDEMGETCDAEISFPATAPDPFIQFDLPEILYRCELPTPFMRARRCGRITVSSSSHGPTISCGRLLSLVRMRRSVSGSNSRSWLSMARIG